MFFSHVLSVRTIVISLPQQQYLIETHPALGENFSPRGVPPLQVDKLAAREISGRANAGRYVRKINPVRAGAKIRLRCTHHDEQFEAIGVVVYVSPHLGMGVYFSEIAAEEQSKLERWLNNPDTEF